MKKLLFILISVFVLSCSRNDKNELAKPGNATLRTFSCETRELPLWKKPPHANPGNGGGNGGNGNGGGGSNPPPPPDTTIRNVIMVDHDGGVLPPSLWSSNEIRYTGAGLNPTDISLVISKIRMAFDSLKVIVTDRQSKFDSTPISNRQKLILTAYNWFGPWAGGVAYMNSFGTGEVTWVFTESLSYNVNNIAQASPHEIGHTLGCYHQSVWDASCNLINSYRPGCTMGYPYDLTTARWITGQSSLFCGHIQNDMQTMIAVVGRKY